MRMPPLETERLIVRPFTIDDLDDIYQILVFDLNWSASDEHPQTLNERKEWLQWTIMSYAQHASLLKRPPGDLNAHRRIVFREAARQRHRRESEQIVRHREP